MNIEEYVDINVMQEIQDEFSEATGLAVVMVGEDGEQLTKPSKFTEFYTKYAKNTRRNRYSQCGSYDSSLVILVICNFLYQSRI